MEYRLLEKTELWISPVQLAEVDLGACAKAAAQALDLDPRDIMVTDATGDRLTLDILVPTIQAEKIVARKERLLSSLRAVSGVRLTNETEVHSDGVLGLISLDENTGQEVLERSRAMAAQIAEHIRRRSMVFSTGSEVLSGQIRDTNTPFLMKALQRAGYQPTQGPALEDRTNIIAKAFQRAAADGYGLVITTGGIGAEAKDQTLEALELVDPHASMPYILKFQKGQGRHQKDGVRIGVGRLEQTIIVCLPGPHDEVQLAWPVVEKGIGENWNKVALAKALVKVLRNKFLARGRSDHFSSEAKAEVEHGSK